MTEHGMALDIPSVDPLQMKCRLPDLGISTSVHVRVDHDHM